MSKKKKATNKKAKAKARAKANVAARAGWKRKKPVEPTGNPVTYIDTSDPMFDVCETDPKLDYNAYDFQEAWDRGKHYVKINDDSRCINPESAQRLADFYGADAVDQLLRS